MRDCAPQLRGKCLLVVLINSINSCGHGAYTNSDCSTSGANCSDCPKDRQSSDHGGSSGSALSYIPKKIDSG